MPKRKFNQFQVSSSAKSLDSSASPERPRENENAPPFSKFPRIYFWLNRTANSSDFDPVDSPSHPDIEDEDATTDVAESIDASIRGLVEEAEIREDDSETKEDYDGVARKLFERQGRVNESEICDAEEDDQDDESDGDRHNSSSTRVDGSEPIDESVHELVEDAYLLGKTDSVTRKLFSDRGASGYDLGSEFEGYNMEEVILAVAAGVHHMQHRKRIRNRRIATTNKQQCHGGVTYA